MPNFRAMRDSLRQKGVQVTIQWNPVTTVTNGPKKIGRINEVVVVFFTRKHMVVLSGGQEKVAVITR